MRTDPNRARNLSIVVAAGLALGVAGLLYIAANIDAWRAAIAA